MVETDINKRWEKGIDHHPLSKKIYAAIAAIDSEHGGDHFCFKSGGDGDNGEHLMYLLDIHFEQQIKHDEGFVVIRVKNTQREDLLTGLRLWIRNQGDDMVYESRKHLEELMEIVDCAGYE